MATAPKTTSETLLEQFLTDHLLPFERIPVADSPRPDYAVGDGTPWGPIIFEVKELTEDDNFGQGDCKLSSRTVGDHIRSKINESRRQIQFGAEQGIPSVLLIYNALDPFHRFGTEPHDFRAAMHGDWTLLFGVESRKILAEGYGRNSSFREGHNTSFAALGHLVPVQRGIIMVRLFLNEHAKVPMPDGLPSCFEIIQ
jgi:hypothetical protein